MATAFATEATHIQKIGHLSAADIARATGANETTVRAWLRGSRSPSGARAERLAELSAIVERLARVMQPTYVPVWMRKPVPLLDDDKPLDVIAAGDYRRVSRVVAGPRDPRRDLSCRSRWRASGFARFPPAPTRSRARPIRPTAAGSAAPWSSAIYFADSPATVWAEWYRALAEAAIRRRWRCRASSGSGRSTCPASPTWRDGGWPGRPAAARADPPAVAGVPGRRRTALRRGLAGAGERFGGASGRPRPVHLPDRARRSRARRRSRRRSWSPTRRSSRRACAPSRVQGGSVEARQRDVAAT